MNNPFEINPQKAQGRLALNSAMIGVLFFVLTFILAFGRDNFNYWAIFQLVMAVPLLYVSVLSYSKVAYWKDARVWDIYGWLTSNLANNIILNAIGLMVVSISLGLALAYFALLIALMTAYSAINIRMNHKTTTSKIWKLAFFLTTIILGGLLPSLL